MTAGGRRRPRGARPQARPLTLRAIPRGVAGQGLVEFAVVLPVLLILVLGIADFGRLYTSMVAVEAAAREAADYGTFKASYWTSANAPTTTAEMLRRACTAAAGSHLEDYAEPAGTVAHATCTNPAMTCTVIRGDGSAAGDCAAYDETANGGACAESTTDPPCSIAVTLAYTFHTIVSFPPIPSSVSFSRTSIFRISDLPVPTASP